MNGNKNGAQLRAGYWSILVTPSRARVFRSNTDNFGCQFSISWSLINKYANGLPGQSWLLWISCLSCECSTFQRPTLYNHRYLNICSIFPGKPEAPWRPAPGLLCSHSAVPTLRRCSVNVCWLLHLLFRQDLSIWGSQVHEQILPCVCLSREASPSRPRVVCFWAGLLDSAGLASFGWGPKGLMPFGLGFGSRACPCSEILTINGLCYFLSPGELTGTTSEGQWEHKVTAFSPGTSPSLPRDAPVSVGQSGNSKPFSWNSKQLEESLQLELEKLPVRRAESYVTLQTSLF